MNKILMNAVLAMDSYNRGYSPKITGGITTNQIGLATVLKDSASIFGADGESASFYAIAYTYNNKTIISYRGTDKLIDDAISGWTIGAGIYDSPQAILAVKFYQLVVSNDSDLNSDIFNNSINLTGHSLGGGLAAFVASAYSKKAIIFDHMPYELAADYLEVVTNDSSSILYDPVAAYTYYGSKPTQEVDNSDIIAYST